jgi:chemotaxis protein MotB
MDASRLILLVVVCSALVGCASTDWETKFRDKERQKTEVEGDLEAARTDLAGLQARNTVLTEQLDRERLEKARMAGALADARARPAEAPAAAAPARPTVDIAALKRKMDFTGVRLDDSGNVVITLESGVTFGSGSAKLSTSGRGILKRVTATLASEFADKKIRLVGHTDTDPIKRSGFADNWSLGFERARAVAVYLRDQGKISEKLIVLESRGPHDPLESNKTDNGKKKNRRVEIIVVLPQDELR